MKKICVILVAVLVMQCLSVVSFASGAFVESPSKIGAPTIVEVRKDAEACTLQVNVCAYGDRSKLEDKIFAASMVDAYEKIATAGDLGLLSDDVKALAEELSIDSSVLVASELFALYATDCEKHDSHGKVELVIEPTVTENFAGLVKYNGVEWEVVSCKIGDGKLTFDFDENAVYSILLHDGTASVGGSFAIIAAIVAGVAAVTVILLTVFVKKKKNEEGLAENA